MVPRIYNRLFMILYPVGTGGEFFTAFLNKHLGVTNQNFDYDPILNKYRTHNPLTYITNTNISDDNLDQLINQSHAIDRKRITILRSHNFDNAQKMQMIFPGIRFIILESHTHRRFFENLFSIKFDTSLVDGVQNWQHLLTQNDIDVNIENYINFRFDYKKILNDKVDYLAGVVGLHKCKFINLDKLYFDRHLHLGQYYELCRWADIRPLDNALQEFEAYHKKNVELVNSFGLSVEPDPLDPLELINLLKQDFIYIQQRNTITQKHQAIVTIPYEPTK